MTSAGRPTSRARERLKWIAPIGLALLVVCMGCFFFFAIGLTARGEMTTSVGGTDFRVWPISERPKTGVGLQRTYRIQRDGQTCTRVDVTFFFWRPALSIDNVTSDNCG
ncbi:MAG TPA: hypothetical protein VFF59_01940 [Anaerolineae bacterium]|nr:hypothetical protein [Anaerolineae bacterium]